MTHRFVPRPAGRVGDRPAEATVGRREGGARARRDRDGEDALVRRVRARVRVRSRVMFRRARGGGGKNATTTSTRTVGARAMMTTTMDRVIGLTTVTFGNA